MWELSIGVGDWVRLWGGRDDAWRVLGLGLSGSSLRVKGYRVVIEL